MLITHTSKWNNFINEIANIFFFWFFSITFFFLFRLTFIFSFFSEIEWENFTDNIFQVIITGFRFDTMVTSYFIIVPLLTTLITSPFSNLNFARRLRVIFQNIFIYTAPLISIITINYYSEYHDQFNRFLFLGLYDDLTAVLNTIIIDFNPYLNVGILLIIIYLFKKIVRYFEKKELIYAFLLPISNKIYKPIFIIIILTLFTISIRGSVKERNIMRKWAYVTNDEFLNKTIITSFKSLHYAIKDFNRLNIPRDKNPFLDVTNSWDERTVCENIEKIAKGNIIKKPKQIFLVVMESYDSWSLQDKYLSFNLSSNLSNIAKKGMSFNTFIPSSESTMNSIASIVTGIPYSGVSQSQIGAINPTYCSSIFNQFEKLGYQTNFFYGGLLSWGNIKNLFEKQGVNNQYSAADKGGKTESGIWGIEDEKLFELAVTTIDTVSFSFNIILTTSYHPPYSIDLVSKGFPANYIEQLPEDILKYYDGSMSEKELGHLWYSDKCIGEFVVKANKKYSNALFCFTGDHFARRFINSKPNLFEKSAVPFIMYGKSIKDSVYSNPGSHIDIFPTLIEMVAPKGFNYFSFGSSLLDEKEIGIGESRIISKNYLDFYPRASKTIRFNLTSQTNTQIDSSSYFFEYTRLNALGWHYTIKGDSMTIKNKFD